MHLTQRSVELTEVSEWEGGKVRSFEDSLAAEEPLELRVNGRPINVTMRTPGHDEELAAGFLLTEGLVGSFAEVASLHQPGSEFAAERNVVEVTLNDASFALENSHHNFSSGSSCGICGKASIDSLRVRGLRSPNANFKVDPEILCQLPDRLRAEQQVFGQTGGLHAAALFDADGKLLTLREDIGRHNAVDKVIGWALLAGLLPLSNHVLMVSGRGGFEIIQKAIAAGIPVVASVSAPSSLAVKLARELSLTLIGFLRGRRFVVYSGESRCIQSSHLPVLPSTT